MRQRCWRTFSTACPWIMGGISDEGKPWTQPASFSCRLQDPYGTVTELESFNQWRISRMSLKKPGYR